MGRSVNACNYRARSCSGAHLNYKPYSDSLSKVSSLNLVDGKKVVGRRDSTKGGQSGSPTEISHRLSWWIHHTDNTTIENRLCLNMLTYFILYSLLGVWQVEPLRDTYLQHVLPLLEDHSLLTTFLKNWYNSLLPVISALYFNLISKLTRFIFLQVGYLGGGLFLIFAVATFFGVF